jgi:hypothetical protein
LYWASGSPRSATRRHCCRALFADASQSCNLVNTAIASTQFLRNTGIEGGYFQGRLYEFLFYQGVLTDIETLAIENYLADR